MKIFKKIISAFLSLVLAASALFAVPMSSMAVNKAADLESSLLKLWIDPENTLTQSDIDSFTSNESKIEMVGAVGVHKRSSDSNYYYMFLPSTADCNNLKVWFSASSTVSVNGTQLTSGQTTDVFSALDAGGIKKDYTLKIGSTSYNLVGVKSGNVGAVYVDTSSGSISRINSSSDHSVSEAGSVMVVQPDGTVDYDGEMESLKGRGNATWSTNGTKNPYALKLAQSASLLGLGKGKKWVLLANSVDKNTLLKDQIIYDYAKYVGIDYQPTCRPVDLYVNQQYYGSYQLCEKVEIKSSRVDINDSYEALEIANGTVNSETGAITPADFETMSNFDTRVYNSNGVRQTIATGASSYAHTVGCKRYSGFARSGLETLSDLNDPDDITGGYIFELEISQRWAEETTGFCAYNRQGWVVKSHDYTSKNMTNYCYDLLYALGSSVYNGGTVPSTSTTTTCSSFNTINVATYGAKTITNPAPAEEYRGKRWSDILDADSAVKYYWIQEFFKNLDSSTTSTYFYKDSDSVDSKLYAGPAWDFDNALGYDQTGSRRWGQSLSSTDGWYAKNTRIYRWRTADSSLDYTSDSQAPLGFYAALATNCSDFDLMARSEWYSNIAPAVDILLGNKTDPKGVLKSTREYAQTIEKSGTMNNMRHEINSSNAYPTESIISGINNWVSGRRTWINSQFGKADISGCDISSIENQTVTGMEIKPKVTLTNNGVELKEGSDYSLSYSNNINAGTANVTITGQGYYTGTAHTSFTINPGTLVGSTVTIRDGAYMGDTIVPAIYNSQSNEINNYISYQWYANGAAISGATQREYIVSEADQGKNLTLQITGDGDNLEAISIVSNPCTVYEGEKPENYTETLAAWEYDYIANDEDIENADTSGESYYYNATSGQLAQGAKLIGSVDAENASKIKWSGIGEEYKNGSPSGKAQVPIMGTSKSDNIAWGEYPFFEVSLSTKRYENISFSAMLGGSKKAPRSYKLQYSLNGTSYTDIDGATYMITTNKAMQQAFSNIKLPDICSDKNTVYIRAVVCEDAAINGIDVIVDSLSGDAAINNVYVTGTKIDAIASLEAPEISTSSIFTNSSIILDTDTVAISDTNGGADVYYSVNSGEYKKYSKAFNPFDESSESGDRATVSAYSSFGDVVSETVSATLIYVGDNINQFVFDKSSEDVFEGALFSNGGAFGKSARMRATTDNRNMYVPLWNDEKKAYAIAPDDGALWSRDSGFTFEVSTSGYKNITFSAKLFTTNYGPKSVDLEYSLNGKDWEKAVEFMDLRANDTLNQSFDRILLPDECNNKTKIYIRIATCENLTFSDEVLFNNLSKGNLYVNDIIISGDENGDIKMPYTNKSSNRFGDSGTIKYYSADNKEMFYTVTDPSGKIILSGRYNDEGISIPSSKSFRRFEEGGYKVSIRAGDDDDYSLTNIRTYYYKGDAITHFSFDGKTNLLEDYLSPQGDTVSNTSGAVSGTLALYPNSVDKTSFTYGDKYAIKASWLETNKFVATKNLDKPNGNGYYLITTSTKGYQGITLSAEQICSNKAPRDWAVAYSTNGTSYTFVENSNVRALSNDAFDSTVQTYNNFALPDECNDKETLYIKIFINGGESVDSAELADVDKGNAGINNVEINGIPIPGDVDITVNTYLLSAPDKTDLSTPVATTLTVNGETVSQQQSSVVLCLTEGTTYTISVSATGTFTREVTLTAQPDMVLNLGVVALDLNADGVINAKDYSKIIRISADAQEKAYEAAFSNFINVKQNSFEYSA